MRPYGFRWVFVLDTERTFGDGGRDELAVVHRRIGADDLRQLRRLGIGVAHEAPADAVALRPGHEPVAGFRSSS